MTVEETMLEIANREEHSVSVELILHPMAKRWLARLERIGRDNIEVYGKTAEIAIRNLKDQWDAGR